MSEETLKQIIEAINEGKRNSVSPEEILEDIKQIFPPERIIIEKEPKTPKEQLEYMKAWREEQKKLKKIRDKEEKERLKIEKAKGRTSFYCYNCKKAVKITNPEDNQADIVQKKNRTKKNITISNFCPICSNLIKSFGGYL